MKNKKLFILLLIIPIIVFFIGRSFSLPDDEEEIELDNWEISTVFYDSTVNNGHTPLTEINWDATDGEVTPGPGRVITVQINYKNTNTVQTYHPGDITIRIPNLSYNIVNVGSTSVSAGANYGSSTGYEWSIKNLTLEYLEFKNVNQLDERSNFEGSIRIDYNLYPGQCNPQRYEEIITKTYNKEIVATINDNIESNSISFNYYRECNFQWKRSIYSVNKSASIVDNIDYLSNPNDYYWVKYKFLVSNTEENTYCTKANPIIYAKDFYIKDAFPNDVILFDIDNRPIEKENDHLIVHSDKFTYPNTGYFYTCDVIMPYGYVEIIAGYPKENYNANNNITNEVELYVQYDDRDEYEYVDTASVALNLLNYNYNLGNLYIYYKTSDTYDLFYENLKANKDIGCKGLIKSRLDPKIKYSGYIYDLTIGDDFLYITDENNQYRILGDNEYYFTDIAFPISLYDGNKKKINKHTYEIDFYVRKKNNSNYDLIEHFYNTDSSLQQKIWEFDEDDGIVSYFFRLYNVNSSIYFDYDYTIYPDEFITSHFQLAYLDNAHEKEGYIINSAYVDVVSENQVLNHVNANSYPSVLDSTDIKSRDLEIYGSYKFRAAVKIPYKEFEIKKPRQSIETNIGNNSFSNHQDLEMYTGKYSFSIEYDDRENEYNEYEYDNLHLLLDREYWNEGYELYNLLPPGMQISSTEEDIVNNMVLKYPYLCDKKTKSGHIITSNEALEYFKERTTVTIIKNWENTGRTMVKIVIDFTDDPALFLLKKQYANKSGEEIWYSYDWYVDYDAIMTYGTTYTNNVRLKYLNRKVIDNNLSLYNYTRDATKDNGAYSLEEIDINRDSDIEELFSVRSYTFNLVYPSSTHQDVQTSVQTDLSNYNTGTITSSKGSEYTYKLRVRTGTNDVTNLVIYDSIEDYAKNPQLEIIKASGGKQYWQGEFLGIDTSYAESKGYTVKTYYNENPKPGSLSEDDSWHEYNDEVDKSKVKSLAFKYLDSEGNPAVLPANSLTYVLISMKSPNEDYITYAYNGCWTEWNAIDPITERPVDFITGINSNIVKVALPRSRDVEDIQLTLTKEWKDGSNAYNTRPNEVKFNLISNGDTSNANEVTITGTGNEWSVNVQAPELDNLGNEIEYSVTENPINTSEGYKYISTVNGLTITNTLYKDITLKKLWKDNSDLYLTRPSNVTYKVKQNGNDYQEVTFNGSLTSNEWTKVITVPVFDNNGNEYTYTVDEVDIDNYSKVCEGLTCTNTLTDNENITVKKVWIDSDNEYNTRPNSIDIKLKQNGNDYQTIHLTGTTSTWESDVIEVPKYDNDGVKYEYTINESQLDEYGLVEYNQSDYQVTNTLKENINITITKKWIDGSNEQGIRPNELKINLLRNNNQYQELTLTGTEDIWTTTIEVPKYDENQKKYTYSIREVTDDINSDYSNITYGEDLSVTNKLEKKKNISISKIWDDSSNKYLTRPESVNIKLLRNGELYKELTLNGNSDTWEVSVNDLDTYDDSGKLYKYTIEEIDQINRYENITYDQTNYTITNKLTDVPKVTLYFTVKNGYTSSGSNDIQYDSEGLNNILRKYKINADDPYEFDFKLENVDSDEVVNGKLSTQGTLKFEDIGYGTYKAREGFDKLFTYVSMSEIEKIDGVSFVEDENGGTITITPTGKDIIYGANIINKIEYEPATPITSANRNYIVIYLLLIMSIFIGLYVYKKKA